MCLTYLLIKEFFKLDINVFKSMRFSISIITITVAYIKYINICFFKIRFLCLLNIEYIQWKIVFLIIEVI